MSRGWICAWVPLDGGPVESRLAGTRDDAVAFAGHIAHSGACLAVVVIDTRRQHAVWTFPVRGPFSPRRKGELADPWAAVAGVRRG